MRRWLAIMANTFTIQPKTAMPLMFELASSLPIPASQAWQRATTSGGINDELFPWLRMTAPPAMRGKAIDELPLGERLGRSWLLAFGMLPVEVDDIMLAEVGPGYRFKETSRMLSMRSWVHERTIQDTPGGCEVHDRLTFELRGPAAWLPGGGGAVVPASADSQE
ncbi:hypothetical protein OR16_27227 [Cupriavidus basilensis OR16]|uniref:Uncharacterized protein n=2 Tax=Cupriavidus basilensis TaxID=68895 RepID=H1SBA0_9BURK|nr:hypothetical protein OR16_27227 [Cupriavidus basilensis OR16]